ncbi:hypothetical protein [Psychrobacter sp. I-STPA10]|uniref:hypothetical protein n=1 Tax=Psychrobacter sp. I-STPA10 TaxID=2585769 RepID=UPI001E526A94|nr:hypothetical protein [Psychrobacter sp. I-STPA10]
MWHTHPSARGELCSSNHIGSSSYLTNANVEVHEFFAYFPSVSEEKQPFGERLPEAQGAGLCPSNMGRPIRGIWY